LLRRAWRRIGSAGPVARLRRRRAVERPIEALRHGRHVRESVRFAVRELRGGGRRAYRLRSCGLTVHLRHNGHDAWVLHEVFGKHAYVPPAEAAAALSAAGDAPRVVDVGAHVGSFGLWIAGRHPHATITAFEPDPGNAELLERTIAANGAGGRWEVIRAAAATERGELRFAAGHGERSHAAEDGEDAITVPAVDLFERLDGADLMKLDIEGGEWPILSDPRLPAAGPGVIALEYHAHLCPEPDPRAAATDRLRAAGYEVLAVEEASLTDEVGMLWAWRAGAPAT
jgi:FkbM family methyltransferase